VPGKRVQFDDETWQAMDAVVRRSGRSFQELADEAFKDLSLPKTISARSDSEVRLAQH
jgi:hypothetical protein